MDLIAEFCLIFILMKISANVVYYYTSYVACYKNCRCFFFINKKKIGLKKTLSSPGRRPDRWSSGRQWHARTVPRRHRWSIRRGVCPGSSAPRLISRAGRWVRILSSVSGRLSIPLVEASTHVLAASAGPIVLITSVSSPASLKARLGRCHVL